MTEDKLFVHDSGGPNECEDKSFVFELESEVRTEKSSTDGMVGWISVSSDGLATLVNADGIRDPGRLRLQVNKGKRTGDEEVDGNQNGGHEGSVVLGTDDDVVQVVKTQLVACHSVHQQPPLHVLLFLLNFLNELHAVSI